jgi:hypothetical protein
LGVFECAVSDEAANVSWIINDQPIVVSKKFKTLSIGSLRRLAIRDCLMKESNSVVKCKWDDLITEATLFVTSKLTKK